MRPAAEADWQLQTELQRAEARVEQLEATLKAIRLGEVDAIVVDGRQGVQIFTLQTPEEPYRILAERMNEGAATLSSEGTILFCNRRLAQMLDLPTERLLGSQFASLLCDPTSFREFLARAQNSDVRVESCMLRNDRSRLPVLLSLTQIPLGDSGHGMCLIATDVSIQKQAEEDVRRLNAELELRVQRRTAELLAASQELEAFSYAVAHDLRAPLRHVHGFSEILSHGASAMNDDGRHCLDCILKEVARMGRMIDDLLNLSRVGRRAMRRQAVEIKKLVEEVVAELEPDLGGRAIEWRLGDLPRMDCDPGLVKIVLANLLSNAVKFTQTRELAVIEVGYRLENGTTVFFVRDNGVGFDMQYAEKLFGVFQRLHPNQAFEGTGIGLATARRSLQKHGGKIWAEAEVERGATFYFILENGQEKDVLVSEEAG
jgi:PAS domain S-box-containing protein